MKKIQTYWWVGKKNFGDIITPLLLRKYRIRPKRTDAKNAKLVLAGSILTDLDDDYNGIILGSGLIEDRWDCRFPKANILGVRGEETRKRIGAPENVVLGDPGLLVDRLIKNRKRKKYIIGFIPHYVDKYDGRIKRLYLGNKNEIKVIDVQKSPKTVMHDINRCENILTSSLHGLIAAHAFGIPSGWISLSNRVIGDGFKFYDYFTSINTKMTPSEIHGYESISDLLKLVREVPLEVKNVKDNLDKIFQTLYAII